MFKKVFPFIIIAGVVLLVFRNFIFKGLLPIPADLLIGAYYPWLDSNWGFPTGVPVKNPLPSDVISILYPWRILGMEILKSGHLPLWDPTILLGTPLLANFQAALLNPFNILFLIFPAPIAWSIEVVLQPFLLALATFVYLRHLGLQKIAATAGALAFAFSGFSIVWMEYNTIVFTLIYFPLSLFFIDKIIQSSKPLYVFLLGLTIAFQLLSGYPQISIYTVIFASFYLFFRLWEKRSKVVQKIMLFAIGIGSALLLAAVQLLPSLELWQLSIRGIDNTAINAGVQFLPLTHVVTLFAPDFFGNPTTANYWLGSYDNFAFFLPAVSVLLALIAFASKIAFKKENIIFILFLILSLALAIDNPLSSMVSQNDYFGLKSAVSARVLFVFDFALAILAALGLNEILQKKAKCSQILIPALFYISVISISLIIVKQTANNNFAISLRNSVLPVVSVMVVSSFLMMGRLWKLFGVVIIGALIFNILTQTDKSLSFIKGDLLFPQTEAINSLKSNLQEHRFDREKGEIFTSNTWIPYGLKAVSGQNALYPVSTSKYLSLVNGYYPNYLFRFVDITGVSSPLYDTLDIKYITVLKRKNGMGPDKGGQILPQFQGAKFKEYQDIGTLKILENIENLGFAWFSKSVKCGLNEKEATEILKQIGYKPKNLMVVSCPADKEVKNLDGGVAKLIKELPGYLELSIETPVENYLHLSQTNYPGWQAFLDGRVVPIYTSNLALTSILISPGNHVLELKYQPSSFIRGLQISLSVVTLWLLYLVTSYVLNKYNIKR